MNDLICAESPECACQPRVVAAAPDGACSGNPGRWLGGIAALLKMARCWSWGRAAQHTNNRMELAAALAVLESSSSSPCIPDNSAAAHRQPANLIDGLGKWMAGWKRKGLAARFSGAPGAEQGPWGSLDSGPALPGVPGPTCAAQRRSRQRPAATPLPRAFLQGRNPAGLATRPCRLQPPKPAGSR